MERELGIGRVVSEPNTELMDADSGLIIDPLCVVVIELMVDGQPPEVESDGPVLSAAASEDDGVIVNVIWREMIVVMKVVVVEVVGAPIVV